MSEVSRSKELGPIPVSLAHRGPTRPSRRVSSGVASVRENRDRFGAVAAARYVLNRGLNRVVLFDSWMIAIRSRDDLPPLDPAVSSRFSCRLATRADLEKMRADPRLDISESKLAYFEAGDLCLMTFVDGRIAGYTWCRREGQFEIVRGLHLSIPHQFFYGHAALTLPEFRGLGLQAFRTYQLFGSDALADKAGEIGYVRATNYPMLHALAKNGTRLVGSVRVLGSRHHFVTHLSPSLRRLGMRRLSGSPRTASQR